MSNMYLNKIRVKMRVITLQLFRRMLKYPGFAYSEEEELIVIISAFRFLTQNADFSFCGDNVKMNIFVFSFLYFLLKKREQNGYIFCVI